MRTARSFVLTVPLCLFLLASAGLFLYSRTAESDFVWDDHELVRTNGFIYDLRFFPQYFTAAEALSNGQIATENYRPLVPLSYALDRRLWGAGPFGYHLTNLILHILTTFSVFFLCRAILGSTPLGLVAAGIFLVHPVQTESVCWIASRAGLLAGFFTTASVAMYARFVQTGRRVWYLSALCCGVPAMLSKESAVIIPALALLIDLFLGKPRFKNALLRQIPFLIIVCAYVLARTLVLGKVAQCFPWTGNGYLTALSMARGLVEYVRLTLWPHPLCADYGTFPLAYSFWEGATRGSCALLLGLSLAAALCRRRFPLVTFCLLWFMFALGPVLNIIPIRILIAERFLYVPLIGWALFVAGVARFIGARYRTRAVRFICGTVIGVLLSGYAVITIQRIPVWANAETLNRDVIASYPDNFRAYNNLAAFLMGTDRWPEALPYIRREIALAPTYPEGRLLYARYLERSGKREEALAALIRATEDIPEEKSLVQERAMMYLRQNDLTNARAVITVLRKRFPDMFDPLLLEAKLCEAEGDITAALALYDRVLAAPCAVHQRASFAALYLQAGTLSERIGAGDRARALFREGIRRFPEQEFIVALLRERLSGTDQR
ncbi:MAG: tetratricopeptide repeat protein [Candidatus Omnitrophica bacterium]|nr:tetratricopeptide repeat protein [Candidatus Omnitrophota bacterium]